MKKMYVSPATEELAEEMECEILSVSNFGKGDEGQQGDVRASEDWIEIESI